MSNNKELNNKYMNVLLFILFLVAAFSLTFLVLNQGSDSLSNNEKDTQYQLFNYSGFVFDMPNNWDFVNDDNVSKISNSDNNILMVLDSIDLDYSSFLSDYYQRLFLEDYQVKNDIRVEKTFVESEPNYYLLEGTKDNYNYILVAIGNDEKTILINTQFEDANSYNKYKKSIIDFSISAILNENK